MLLAGIWGKQADVFAICLLAPLCVLHGLNIYAAKEIAAVCGIPMQEAQKRAADMEAAKMSGMYTHTPLEAQVLKLFKGFS